MRLRSTVRDFAAYSYQNSTPTQPVEGAGGAAAPKSKAKRERGRPLTSVGYAKLLKQAHKRYLADIKAGRVKPITVEQLQAMKRAPVSNGSNLKAFRKACRAAGASWPELRKFRFPDDDCW